MSECRRNPGGEREAAFSSVANGFLAAFVAANLFILCSAPARADVHFGATTVDAVHRTVAMLRGQQINALTLVLAFVGFILLSSFLFRGRRNASRAKLLRARSRTLQAEIDRLKALLLSEPQIL